MGLYDTALVKVDPEKSYMTPGEQAMFKRLVKTQTISIFRCTKCKVCQTEVPKPKMYCSITCYQKENKEDDNGEEEHWEVD